MRTSCRRVFAVLLALVILCGAGAHAEGAILADGEYIPDGFSFSGGSGKVTITCPKVVVAAGEVTATLVFSSLNYPRVTVDGAEYAAGHDGDSSIFQIPAQVNADMTVVGTTTAMSAPHDVEYTIHISIGESGAMDEAADAPEAERRSEAERVALENRDRTVPGLIWRRELPLKYAREFAVDYYDGGYKLLTIGDGNRYLVVPEGGAAPEGLDGSVRVVRQPLRCVYLAATASMARFDALDALDVVRLSGTQASGWYIENAVEAMERGDMLYAGKYSEPDYELLLGEGCDLAIESTMILHTPKVQEMIEQLGIPVLIERSSYEAHPLGRTEWVKLYAALVDREAQAEAFFDEQAAVIDALKDFPNTEKKVAFFYIASDGGVVVRSARDYVAGMIELAGGRYVFDDALTGESARSSISISMEDFYAAAVDADYLIYNGSIDAPLNSVDDLLGKSGLFADFKAVRSGDVWSTDRYLYQATDIVGELIADINRMLLGETEGMRFLKRVA